MLSGWTAEVDLLQWSLIHNLTAVRQHLSHDSWGTSSCSGPPIGTSGCSYACWKIEHLLKKRRQSPLQTTAPNSPNHWNSNNTKHAEEKQKIGDTNRRLCSLSTQPYLQCHQAVVVHQWRTRSLALLTTQMLYVSCKLNFTPGFLLIRGSSGAPALLISMVRGHNSGSRSPSPGVEEMWRNEARERERRENRNYRCDGSEWKRIIWWGLSDVWFWNVIIHF